MYYQDNAVWVPFYDDTEEEKKKQQQQEQERLNEEAKLKEKKFTQEDVNKFLAEDKRKTKSTTEKLISELEELKKVSGLSQKERDQLQSRIEELQTTVLTKDQLLEKEKNRLSSEHRTELQKEKEERERWKNKYTDATIRRTLTDAAVEHEAFSPEQIVALLNSNTRLVEELDAEGKGTGEYLPKVKFSDTDAEGKPITLDLTVKEAVKRMKELPDRFGNLFKSHLSGGLGGSQGVGSKIVDNERLKNMDEYRKNREKLTGRKGIYEKK